MIKYDSNFEKELAEGVLCKCEYHPSKLVEYQVLKTYEPDFVKGKYLIEAKGRFRDRNESNKYLWIRKALPKNKELVFLFMNHKTPMPAAKRRKKCGTKQSMGEWATKNGFKWYTPRTAPLSWGK